MNHETCFIGFWIKITLLGEGISDEYLINEYLMEVGKTCGRPKAIQSSYILEGIGFNPTLIWESSIVERTWFRLALFDLLRFSNCVFKQYSYIIWTICFILLIKAIFLILYIFVLLIKACLHIHVLHSAKKTLIESYITGYMATGETGIQMIVLHELTSRVQVWKSSF